MMLELDHAGVALGSRARAKLQTRADIVSVAIGLFALHGFDSVTTEQIAEEVGITQRTLFRYFQRKDDIIYGFDYNYAERFEGYLDEAVTIWDDPSDALRSAFVALASYFDGRRERASTVYRIVQASEVLRARERVEQGRIDRLVAYALEGREAYLCRIEEPSLQARLMAGILFGAIRPMFRAWLSGELSGELRVYAEIGWANVAPVLIAARLYAEDSVSAFSRIGVRPSMP